jgi:PHAX RNA-binding domain-containing protein
MLMEDTAEQTPQQIADQIGDTLGENNFHARRQIKLIVELVGVEFVQAVLQETLTVEANGGMLTLNESRRRTPGGVFLYLARARVAPELVEKIFPPGGRYKKEQADTSDQPKKAARPQYTLIPREELRAIVKAVLEAQGDISSMKVTLIGRPGQIEQRGPLVVTAMKHDGTFPSLPKGLPAPPKAQTTYLVYIAAKQWNRVAESITKPEDKLIIEGQLSFDPKLGQIVVYTTNVTTKLLDQAKRAETKGEVPAQPKPAQIKAEAPVVDNTAKLAELREAERIAAEKLAALQALPASERTGVMSAMKALQDIRTQIKLLAE